MNAVLNRKPLDLADIHVWLEALNHVAKLDAANAHQIMRDLADPLNQISEYIDMVRYSPEHICTQFELMWRRRHATLLLHR